MAYFVAFTPSDTCNAETILRTLHEQKTEADVCQLRTNLKPLSDETYDEASEKLLRELYLVVKDHNNNAVQEMTARSNQFCLPKKMYNFVDDWNEEQLRQAFGCDRSVPFQMNHFRDTSLNLVIVNERDYGNVLQGVYKCLRRDGLKLHLLSKANQNYTDVIPISSQPVSDFFIVAEKLSNAMRNFRSPHVLYRGDIYAKQDIAVFTFVRLMDTEAYLNKLLLSPVMREGILKHYQMLLRLMKNRECEVFPQIS